jgi:hypothetical protein
MRAPRQRPEVFAKIIGFEEPLPGGFAEIWRAMTQQSSCPSTIGASQHDVVGDRSELVRDRCAAACRAGAACVSARQIPSHAPEMTKQRHATDKGLLDLFVFLRKVTHLTQGQTR